jgi:DME family drug/metabolite transporter
MLVVVNLLTGITAVQTPQSWLLLIYLGLVPSALAYWLFQMGLRAVPATAASIIHRDA